MEKIELPETITTTEIELTFTLRDARVRGQEILISNPHDWQDLEEQYITHQAGDTLLESF